MYLLVILLNNLMQEFLNFSKCVPLDNGDKNLCPDLMHEILFFGENSFPSGRHFTTFALIFAFVDQFLLNADLKKFLSFF